MKKLIVICVVIFGIYAALLAANPSRQSYVAGLKNQQTQEIWVNSNGWHTGIIVPIARIPQNLLPEKTAFSDNIFLEMGWGDAGFYQAEEITTVMALRALFSPSPSVVHLVGFNAAPAEYFPAARVIRLHITQEGFIRLMKFMDASISRAPSIALHRQEGLYGNSRFYAGSGTYSVVHTCNHWAADGLKTAGIPLTPWYAATSGALMWQLQRYAAH